MEFYRNNNYKEVCFNINGQTVHALIVDVNPFYISNKYNCTNGDLMRKGKAPVVPGNESDSYHIHHIGQTKDSPFAVIPGALHSAYDSVLHDRSQRSEDDLHDKDFENKKSLFWKHYLSVYLDAGRFEDIEGVALKGGKRRKEDANRALKNRLL